MDHLKFGPFIKNARITKHLNGEKIAERAGISRPCLYNIENNVNVPTLSRVLKILSAVGETLESFAQYLKESES